MAWAAGALSRGTEHMYLARERENPGEDRAAEGLATTSRQRAEPATKWLRPPALPHPLAASLTADVQEGDSGACTPA